MDEQNNKIIETLIVQAEQLIDTKNDTINRITSLNNFIEQEKSNLEDYNIRETSLFEEIIFETKDLNLLNDLDSNELTMEELIQHIQNKISKDLEENSLNEKFQVTDTDNIIEFDKSFKNKNLYNKKIDDFNWNMSDRLHNCLKNCGITTLGEILNFGQSGLLRTPNFGRKTLNELNEFILKEVGILIPLEGSNFENGSNLKTELDKGIKEVINEILDDMTPWESAMLKYRYGLIDQININGEWKDYEDYLEPGENWNYKTCYYKQSWLKKVLNADMPIWSYTTTIKYIDRAFRKLKHPTRANRLNIFLKHAEKLAQKQGKTTDFFYIDDNDKSQIGLSEIPECNNFYYAFICKVFGNKFII